MKRFLIVLFICCICVVLILWGYVRVNLDENYRKWLQTELAQAVLRYEMGQTPCVSFQDAFPFGWDSVYIFRPYRSSEEIDHILGTFWPTSRFLSISSDDRITLLVFTQRGAVVQHLEVPRGLIDLASADNGKGYSPQAACFATSSVIVTDGFYITDFPRVPIFYWG